MAFRPPLATGCSTASTECSRGAADVPAAPDLDCRSSARSSRRMAAQSLSTALPGTGAAFRIELPRFDSAGAQPVAAAADGLDVDERVELPS